MAIRKKLISRPERVSKLTFRALALRQSEWGNSGLCVFIYELVKKGAVFNRAN